MQKKNKIFMGIVATLLCLTLMSSCLVSGIFAKFAFDKTFGANVVFKKWGITVTPGSDVAATYTMSDDTVVIQAKTDKGNAFAPGTNGCLAWFKVKADNPEVKFALDFENTGFSIGSGFTASSKLIKDSYGNPIEYFPIILYLIAYDVTYDANGNEVLSKSSVTPINDFNTTAQRINYIVCHQRKSADNKDINFAETSVETHATYAFNTIDSIQKALNGEYKNTSKHNYCELDLSKAFDSATNDVGSEFERIYTVQWCWPYKAGSTYPTNGIGAEGGRYYQDTFYDTQIGEAIAKGSNAFTISVDMSLTVNQVQ